MRDLKICENNAQDLLNVICDNLEKKGGENYHDSVRTSAMLASLMYLQKKDALRIKSNTFSSMLPADDPLYKVVNEYLFSLNETGASTAAIGVIRSVMSGKISTEQYLDALDELQTYDREYGMFGQPKEFAALVQRILDLNGKTIFNPFSGMMSFASAFEGYSQFTGVEQNQWINDYARLRLALSDKSERANAICDNVNNWTNDKFDIIVTNPPLGMRIQMNDKLAHGTEDAASVALHRFEETTSNEGQMCTFVNSSLLSSTVHSSLREELTKKNYLEAIICLPNNVLRYTAIGLSIVVLKKNREAGAPIKMIDATKMFSGTRVRVINVDEIMEAYAGKSDYAMNVSINDIASKFYSWDATFYHTALLETYREGFEVKSIMEILQPVKGDKKFSETEGRLVTVSTLPSDWTNYILCVDDIKSDGSLRNAQKISTPVILMSMIGKTLKTAYCDASESNPIFISPSVNAFSFDDSKIHAGYLCMELSKKVIPSTGIVIPHINQKSLALIKVNFPSSSNGDSRQQQANLFDEAKTALQISKVRELGLQEVIEKMKADYMNEIRSRKHDMMPHLKQISCARKNLEYYMSHKDKYSEQEFVKCVNEEIANQKKAIESLSTLLQIFSRESKFGNPEKINIDQFLTNHHWSGENYIVEHNTDYEAFADNGFDIPEILRGIDSDMGSIKKRDENGNPIFANCLNVFMAEDDLQRLFDNIIGNAIKHGFNDPTRKDYKIWTTLTLDKERNMFRIDISNNGTPLPKGLDKLRYGLKGEKAGETGGTGEGGYIVKSIVEHYNGDYDIIGDENRTSVIIYLPINI